jgi:hypothetical protein
LQSTQSQDVDPEQPDMNGSANLSENNSLDISLRREQWLECNLTQLMILEFDLT